MNREGRTKLSTTVAAENYRYLSSLVEAGKAESLADAVDEAIEHLRRAENRRRLAKATVEYFDSLSPEALAEESSIAGSLQEASRGIDFDQEL